MDHPTSSPSAARSLWKLWWDGVWLWVAFSLALAILVLPSLVVSRLARTVGGTVFERSVGLAFAIVAGPVILSWLFRTMDYRRPDGSP